MPLPQRIDELFRQVPVEKDSARRVELMRELRILLAEDRKRLRARTLPDRALNRSDAGRGQEIKPSPKLNVKIKTALEFVRLIWHGFNKAALPR